MSELISTLLGIVEIPNEDVVLSPVEVLADHIFFYLPDINIKTPKVKN